MKINSGFSPLDIAVSGLRAQGKKMEVISSNVANARSTDNGDGEPYRKLDAIFKANGDKDGIGGVSIDDIMTDMSDFPTVLKPGHPNADENGYVSMPNVQIEVEMMNLGVAARAYQANNAVLKRYQDMVESTLELLR
jgi:flagellar basal-body rod protein FlgC